jgi:gamma-glutamylcyclotransferase (GGCT)/AIG2-like uncharacterized protein YtfP
MPNNVFAYGSLMFPDVWEKVVRGHYRSARALLRGHARYEITGETYPGMVPAAGESVPGVVYFDVTRQDMAALDGFEGSDYRRERVEVTLDSGESVTVDTYIYLQAARLRGTPWHPEAFRMQRFLDTYCRSRLAE